MFVKHRSYPLSTAVLRKYDKQVPELLAPDAWAGYMGVRAAEDAQYEAADRARIQKLLDSQAKGHATQSARRATRRLKVAEAIAADPNTNLTELARTLGVSRWLVQNFVKELGEMPRNCCPGCLRPIDDTK